MKLKLAIFSIFLVGLVLGAVVMGAAVSLVQIQNIGTIRSIGVEVYADEDLSQILSQIAWGTLDLGESASFCAWIKNTGSDAQRLVLWTENWIPTDAQNFIFLSWDYANSWIPAGDSLQVEFTLSVDPTIEGVSSFSFDIWVKGVA